MRNPLARYYDWATEPRWWNLSRIWIALPLLPVIPLMFLADWLIRAGSIDDPLSRSVIFGASVAIVPVWMGYVAWRLLRDAIAAGRWFARETGPSWRGGWRAAWRNLRRRSGKTG